MGCGVVGAVRRGSCKLSLPGLYPPHTHTSHNTFVGLAMLEGIVEFSLRSILGAYPALLSKEAGDTLRPGSPASLSIPLMYP